MQNKFLNGFIAAPYTPMNEKGEIKLKTIESYAGRLKDNGLTGAFVCGTTGEGPSICTEERKSVLEEWIIKSNGNLKIIAHVGGTCLSQSVDLAGHASEKGAFAIAAIAPYFFKPSTAEDLVSFLQPIAGAAPELPFYYYHMPSMTGVDIPVSTIIPLARKSMPNFAGVKFTHFDLMDMQESIEISKGEVEILNGFDEILICGLSLGLKSAVGSTYNFMPSVYMDMKDAFNKNDLVKARELQNFSIKVIRILNRFGGAIRAGKVIMDMTGIDCGPCRLPIPSMRDDEKDELKKELKEAGFMMI
ncbi:MAG: dihydrodipicolinate synthase family protein [Bacteroidales bacterium]